MCTPHNHQQLKVQKWSQVHETWSRELSILPVPYDSNAWGTFSAAFTLLPPCKGQNPCIGSVTSLARLPGILAFFSFIVIVISWVSKSALQSDSSNSFFQFRTFRALTFPYSRSQARPVTACVPFLDSTSQTPTRWKELHWLGVSPGKWVKGGQFTGWLPAQPQAAKHWW